MRIRTRHVLFALVALIALGAPACGDDGAKEGVVRVPQDQETIQEAVDAAEPGDLILVDEGIYKEAVDVTTEDLTIRGVDRNEVILDGEFELENGIRVLDTDGVVVENMTARNYTCNGFFWTGVGPLPRLVPDRLPQRRLRHLRLRRRTTASSTTATARAAPTPASTSASATPATP